LEVRDEGDIVVLNSNKSSNEQNSPFSPSSALEDPSPFHLQPGFEGSEIPSEKTRKTKEKARKEEKTRKGTRK
jgi:hypothetical protein